MKGGNFSTKSLLRALGLLLFLFALFILLSPDTAFFPIAYGLSFVFGLPLYYVVVPYLMTVGLSLAIKGKWWPLKGGWRYFVSTLLLALSLAFFLSFGGIYAGNFMSGDAYLEGVSLAYGRSADLYVSLDIAGGYVVSLLASGLSSLAGNFLPALIASFLFLASLVSYLYPYLASYVTSLDSRLKEKRAAKPIEEAEEEKVNEETGGFYFKKPPVLLSDEGENVSGERYAPEAPSSLPREVTPSPIPAYIPPSKVSYPGLREARLTFPDEAHEAPGAMKPVSAPAPEEKQPEPAAEKIENELSLSSLEAMSSPNAEKHGTAPNAAAEPKADSASGISPSFASSPTPFPSAPEMSSGLDSFRTEPEAQPSPLPSFALGAEPAKEENAPKPAPEAEIPAMEEEKETVDSTPLPGELSLEDLEEGPVELEKEPEPSPMPVTEPEPLPPEPEPEPEPLSPYERLGQPKARPLPPYTLPPLSLLKVYEGSGKEEAIAEECERRKAIIDQAFADFRVGARVVGYTVGPSVTRYDIQCDPSVPVSTIGRYVQDISVRLSGIPTRFEEVVRGKPTSGLEIANSETTIVSLKEMIEHLPVGEKKNLFIPFGKSISGDYVSANLADFPHMLIAGGTGSGKSIFVHGILMSLIMRNRPEDLKLVLIDPKRVEFSKYRGIPHLLTHIINEADEANVCLKKLIDEMERRYKILEEAGVSDIRQFNMEVAPEEGIEKIPYIVIVVDEYADISQGNKEIADSIVRLAQKARAAGMHLIIATQRPSVDVITGVIKANLQVRVALRVSSSQDSTVILSQGGAEELNGYGDMLVDCSLVSRSGFTRCQGCMVDNREIKAVVEFVKNEQGESYDPRFVDLSDEESGHASETEPIIDKSALKAQQGDEFYRGVVEAIIACEFTSISKIQRQFGIGFPRAGRIFAHLQKDGIVAMDSAPSSKGCPVLVHTMEEASKLITSEAKDA